MAAATRELRILGGFHAGGGIELPVDGTMSLGSDADNDVVLRDAPFASARLRWQDGALLWQDARGEVALSREQRLESRGLKLLICLASRSWEESVDDVPVLALAGESEEQSGGGAAANASAEPSRTDELADPVDAAESNAQVQPTLLPSNDPPSSLAPDDLESHEAPPPHRRVRPAHWVALGMATALLLGLMLRAGLNDRDETEPVASTAPESRDVLIDPAILTAVRGHIRAARLEPQVRASIVGDRIRLSGVVESDEAMEALLRRVSTSTGQIDLDLLTQAEFGVRVREMSATLPGDVSASAAALGQISLDGTVESGGERTQLAAMAQRLVPQASSVRNQLLTRAERALLAAERTKTAETPPLVPASTPASPLAAAPKLPAMAAVVSGESGYLILSDGSRVLPGGMMQGIRLERIGETELIVSNQRGQRFRIAR